VFSRDCDGCKVRDDTIAQLRQQVEDFQRTILALADAKAYAVRYPRGNADRQPPLDAEGHPIRLGPQSPAELRRQRFKGAVETLTAEEIERSFAAEAEARNRGEAV